LRTRLGDPQMRLGLGLDSRATRRDGLRRLQAERHGSSRAFLRCEADSARASSATCAPRRGSATRHDGFLIHPFDMPFQADLLGRANQGKEGKNSRIGTPTSLLSARPDRCPPFQVQLKRAHLAL
jgi:hypothetical protein